LSASSPRPVSSRNSPACRIGMRAVLQRVSRASVAVGGKTVSSIGKGMLVLVGFHRDDAESDMEYIARKILSARIFDDVNGVMNLSVGDVSGEILLVSQFTLYGDARKGKRPSYSDAMAPDAAIEFYKLFTDKCRAEYGKVESGVFGAMMDVSLVNSGPVTILLDSAKIF